MKIYLLSYGDSRYTNQKKVFEQSASASSFFDEICMLGPGDIDQTFSTAVGPALQAGRGGGYWLWKPYVVKKILDQIGQDDILFYADAGCIINSAGAKRFNEYIDILRTSEYGTLDFELPFKEYQYTKTEVFNFFQSPAQEKSSNQLLATVLLFRKCTHSEALINSWYHMAITYPALFTDQLTFVQDVNFIDHRHDQSLFSVLRKRYGANIIKDETWFADFKRDGAAYPFWATRMRG